LKKRCSSSDLNSDSFLECDSQSHIFGVSGWFSFPFFGFGFFFLGKTHGNKMVIKRFVDCFVAVSVVVAVAVASL